MKISSEEIILQTTSSDDTELRRLLEDYHDIKYMSEKRLYPSAMPSEYVFRIEAGSNLIGEARLTNIKWLNRKSELSLALSPAYYRKGYGSMALNLLIRFAFDTMNFHRLEAEIVEENTASLTLFRKAGFIMEGRLREAKYINGKYQDILRYGLLREEYNPEWMASSDSIL